MLNHFVNISNTHEGNFTPDEHDSHRVNPVYIEQLDCPLTIEEITKSIKSMHRFKSCDFDNNVADFFIDANGWCMKKLQCGDSNQRSLGWKSSALHLMASCPALLSSIC